MDRTPHHQRPKHPRAFGLNRRRLLTGAASLAFCHAAGAAEAREIRRRKLAPNRTPLRRGWRRRRIMQRFRERGPAFREQVAEARRSGALRPLRELNARLRDGGFELLDADVFETEKGWMYDIRVLGPGGRVRDVLIDGRTLRRMPDPPPD